MVCLAKSSPATQLVPKNDHGPVSSVIKPILAVSWALAVAAENAIRATPTPVVSQDRQLSTLIVISFPPFVNR
jgi:hypothetical protein